jgi:hypothetical protein
MEDFERRRGPEVPQLERATAEAASAARERLFRNMLGVGSWFLLFGKQRGIPSWHALPTAMAKSHIYLIYIV